MNSGFLLEHVRTFSPLSYYKYLVSLIPKCFAVCIAIVDGIFLKIMFSHRSFYWCRAGFLSSLTVDILGWVILCYGKLTWALQDV